MLPLLQSLAQHRAPHLSLPCRKRRGLLLPSASPRWRSWSQWRLPALRTLTSGCRTTLRPWSVSSAVAATMKTRSSCVTAATRASTSSACPLPCEMSPRGTGCARCANRQSQTALPSGQASTSTSRTLRSWPTTSRSPTGAARQRPRRWGGGVGWAVEVLMHARALVKGL